MSDKPIAPNHSLAIIVAAFIVAGAIVFAAVHVGKPLPRSQQAAANDDGDEDASAETQDRFVDAEKQFLQQMAPLAKYFHDIEVQSVRITHNEKMMRIDFTGKTSADKPAEAHYIELTEDPVGRYVGSFTFGGEKVTFSIY